jgi:hypothetical protein
MQSLIYSASVIARVSAIAAMSLLGGCEKPANDNPLFPLGEGRSWTYRIASRTPNDKVAMLDRAPRTVLPAKLSKEEKWTTTTSPYFLKRRNEWPQEFKYVDRFRDLTMTYAVEATEQKVSTPAGDYSGCVLIKGVTPLHIWHEREMTYKEAPMVNLEWYCPNVGLVQLERHEPTTARFFQGGVMRMTLLRTKSF